MTGHHAITISAATAFAPNGVIIWSSRISVLSSCIYQHFNSEDNNSHRWCNIITPTLPSVTTTGSDHARLHGMWDQDLEPPPIYLSKHHHATGSLLRSGERCSTIPRLPAQPLSSLNACENKLRSYQDTSDLKPILPSSLLRLVEPTVPMVTSIPNPNTWLCCIYFFPPVHSRKGCKKQTSETFLATRNPAPAPCLARVTPVAQFLSAQDGAYGLCHPI